MKKKKQLSFYIAGPFTKKEELKKIMREVESNGHKISFDWTQHPSIKPYENNTKLAGKFSQEDINGAINCDIFVVFPEAEGGSTLFSELGAAIVTPRVKKIFAVGPHTNRSAAFFHPRVQRVKSMKEVYKLSTK